MLAGVGEVALISVSLDLGAGRRGVDMGPSALRIAGLTEMVADLGYGVYEGGHVTAGGFETTEQGESGARFLHEIADVCRRTGALISDVLAHDRFPLVVGGDHSLAIGSVSAVARHYRERGESIGLIWVDAHADMNTPDTTPSGNIHGMPLAVLMGRGAEELVALSGEAPAVSPEHVAILGLRDVDAGERELIRSLGVRAFTMSEIDERGVASCMDEALERVSTGTAGFHLSFDLDALDSRHAPGVGTAVQGGLNFREGHLICEKAARSGRLLGLEVVELNPVLDDRNHTARLAVGLMASALGKVIL
jgi:arginase